MKLVRKTFNEAVIKGSVMILNGESFKIKKGKHAIWIPHLPGKIIWSFQGKITPFNNWQNGKDSQYISYKRYYLGDGFEKESLVSILNEYEIFKLMASKGFSPKVHGLFYIKKVISDFFESE